jgi:RNA polymerase sigma-70 factor (ECF subfamily)
LFQSDAKLVKACVDGDSAAWETIVSTYSKRIYNLAYRYTGRYDVAQDLTQDVFLRIYQTLHSFNPASGSLVNWLLKVARNLIIDHFRQTRRYQKVAGSEELETLDLATDHRQDAVAAIDAEEQAQFVRAGLEALAPELKEAVILRDIEGLSYQEITDMLKIPEGTVKSRINRGRVELAKILKKRKARFSS